MKKIKNILILLLIFVTSIALADDVSVEQAQLQAKQFALAQTVKQPNKRKISAFATPKLAYSMNSKLTEKANVYIFNLGNDQGFVVVSGDTDTKAAVLGYSDRGSFKEENMPCCLRALLTQYSAQIDYLRSVPSHDGVDLQSPTASSHPRNISGIGNVVVEPLVTTKWSQSEPYNDLCPVIGDYMRGLAGCGPVAVAQVMAYWKYPQQGRGSYYYYWNPSPYTRFDYGRDFSTSVYDWDNMLNEYTDGYTDVQGEAVALLMADVGAAMHTIYDYNPNIGSGSSPFRPEIILPKYFDYNPDSIRTIRRYLDRQFVDNDDFDQYIKQELDKYRPVILAAKPSPSIQDHFIVVDGYTDTDYFHMNFGWAGMKDGYYMTTAIDTDFPNPEDIDLRYQPWWIEQQLICGICPSYSIREGDNYFYIADGQAILNHSGATDALTIPSSITTDGTTYPVAKISRMACYENETLASVQMPLSVKEIGERAFFLCDNLSTITAPENESPSRYECTLPEQLTTMGPYAFACTGITDIKVPASLDPIPDYAFYRCDQLKKISFLAKEVGTMAFGRCSSKPSVYFYHNVNRLGDGAFFYHGVEYIYLGNVKHIGNDCLSSSNIDRVPLDKIETIGWNQAIVKTDGTVIIGKDAPIKSLHRYAPLHHSSFTVVEEGNSNFVSINNTVYSKDRKTLVHFGWKNDQLNASGLYETRSELTVPGTVKRINDFAIGNNPHLKKLTIPATVNEIGAGNFPNGAEVFNYSTMPQPVKLLDETYFEGCTMEDDLIDVGAQSYGTTEEELDMLLNQPIAATLHVPVGCKDIYASADVWKNFTTIVDDLTGTPSGIPEYLSPLTPHPSPLYTLDGKLVPSQLSNAQGIYILKSVDKTYKTRIRQ